MPTSFSHRPPRHWLQIDLSVPEDFRDYACYQLTEITGSGVQLVDKEGDEIIIGYLEKNDDYKVARARLDSFLKELNSKLNIPVSPVLTTIAEENWAENWKENYKPSRITGAITVKPTWEPYNPAENEVVIEIDPGMAFGTGLHSSTRLALTFIYSLFTAGDSLPEQVLDVGTGTGILAIAAAKLGARQVTAIDNDIDAVVAAQENINQNNEAERIMCSGEDLSELKGAYDLVIANITADVLTMLCPELARKTKSGGHLILAGILQGHQADKVIAGFSESGFQLVRQLNEGKWASLLFTL